ncbi:MAG: hypothetical protein NZM37_10935 [Sandaracinaceae bacterium]|nr:hypothetical protein [Sandaracinaceae bacterium]
MPRSLVPFEVQNRVLRAGPTMRDPSLVERFSIYWRGCHWVFEGSLDAATGGIDLEIVFDEELRPLRAWKRSTRLGSKRPITDIRAYDFQGPFVLLARRFGAEVLEGWRFKKAKPRLLLPPGRGGLSFVFWRLRLEVGERVREPALDLRGSFEKIRPLIVVRHPDRQDPELGRVRVYAIDGREPVFTDEQDLVVGDLAGLRPASLVKEELPPPIPRDGPPRPELTP